MLVCSVIPAADGWAPNTWGASSVLALGQAAQINWQHRVRRMTVSILHFVAILSALIAPVVAIVLLDRDLRNR